MKPTIIFGLHAVIALLKNHPERIIRLCILENRTDHRMHQIFALAEEHAIQIENVSKKELDRLAEQANHQGVVAISREIKYYSESDLETILLQQARPFLLILDGLQDPHNLGACLRTADAAGVHAVIAPRDKSVGLTPTVIKVASGASETVPFIQVTNLARTMRYLKEQGVWIYGAAGDAKKDLYQTDLRGNVAIVMGAEGEGLRRLTREHCDELLKIPLYGCVSSLNVSVAAGIFLFEVARQNRIMEK